jgi:micrococcal nuclease
LRLTAAVAGWGMSPPGKFTYPISAIRVIDGDTIEADVDLGFRIRQRQIIRLAGIDAPELRSKDAEERKDAQFSKNSLTRLLVEWKPSEVVMHSTGLDKYGRSLARIYATFPDSVVDASAWMLDFGIPGTIPA